MPTYSDEAIVIRTHKLGEADRIAALITKDHGKVRCVVKGARKTRSKLGPLLEPLHHVDLHLNEGRGDLDIATGVVPLSKWPKLRSNFGCLTKALTLAEAADQISVDRHPDPKFFELLRGALTELERQDSELLVASFLLKALAHEGMEPQLYACAAGSDCAEPVALDVALGGVVCEAHRRGRKTSQGALQTMRAILGGGLTEALSLSPSAMAKEVENLTNQLWEHRLDRRLKSRNLLDS